jgi:DNA-directed RNA polymerase specialized sigma subunit, sigma24 homolog
MDNNAIFVNDIELGNNINLTANNISLEMKESRKQFEIVYKSNIQKVIYFANSYLNDITEAENIAHDVFVVFWRNIDNIERDKMVTYIFITTKHMCINVLKRRTISNKYTTYKSKVAYLNYILLKMILQLIYLKKICLPFLIKAFY